MIAAADAIREAAGARAKFPGNTLNHLATMEEVGEHAQALLEHSRGKATAEQVYAEAIQCAAMYLRLATEGTAECPYVFTPALSSAFQPTTPKLSLAGIEIVAAPALPGDKPETVRVTIPRPVGGPYYPRPVDGPIAYHGLIPSADRDPNAH